jgi:23S rRNA G2445 N2-methylase RlmL
MVASGSVSAARPGGRPDATLIARCVHGFEWICADEVTARLADAGDLALSRREITFRLSDLSHQVFQLRTVDDVFVEVGQVSGVGTSKDVPHELARRLVALPWPVQLERVRRLRVIPAAPLVDVVASIEGRRGFNRFAVENTFGELLARLTGGTYLSRSAAGRMPGEPDLTVRIFVRDQTAVAALRIGAQPLHRRAYKQDTGPGTLHPPVAAALARLADPLAGSAVLDPFCGDGTIAIETALAYPQARVRASDIDPARVRHATRNAGRAGVHPALSAADALLTTAAGDVDVLVTNPPWNLAVEAGGELARSLVPFWRRVPELLAPTGRLVAVTEADLDAPAALRRAGLDVGMAIQVRLAGRVSHVVLAGTGGSTPQVPHGAARWRERAIAARVVTSTGF